MRSYPPGPGDERPRLSATAAGTHLDAFGAPEWGLLAGIAIVWGASFLFIDIGLDAFAPAVIAFARLGPVLPHLRRSRARVAGSTVRIFPGWRC